MVSESGSAVNVQPDFFFVLILVVMEDGLREEKKIPFSPFLRGLNPCCYGRWSQSRWDKYPWIGP